MFVVGLYSSVNAQRRVYYEATKTVLGCFGSSPFFMGVYYQEVCLLNSRSIPISYLAKDSHRLK